MQLFAAITCTALLWIPGIFGLRADVGKEIPEVTMTREDNFKEVEVSIPENFLKNLTEQGILHPIWRVKIEVKEVGQGQGGQNMSKGSNRTLLNVLIGRGQDAVNFQLPRSHAAERDKKIEFDSALARSVDICPSRQKITEASTLLIRLASMSLSPILVKVSTALVEMGGGWRPLDMGDRERGVQIESQFWFSNPLIHTVGLDKILLGRDHYVNLRIKSEENSPCFCSLLSVQKAQCPYFDTIADAKRFGRWQTMDENTSMVIDTREFTTREENKLLIVLIGAEDKVCNFVNNDVRRERCEGRKGIDGGLRKNVTITLEPTARTEDRLKATFIVAIGYLGITIVCFIVSGILFKFNWKDRLESRRKNPAAEGVKEDRQIEGGQTMLDEGEERKLKEKAPEIEEGPHRTPTVRFEEISLLEEGEENALEKKDPEVGDGQTMLDIDPQRTSSIKKNLKRRILPLTAAEKSRARYKKNQLYMGGLLIISVFYAVTVLQTAFHAQKVQYETGNNDICYYNSRCQIPLRFGHFLDFNHFFSNLGYVVFGLT